MIDVITKHDGLGIGVGRRQILGDFTGDQFSAFFQHQRAIHVDLVINPVFNQQAVLVGLTFARTPALQILVDVDTHHFIRSQKTVFDTLLQRIAVNRFAEVINTGNILSFFGRGGQTDMSCG